ncbi:MAG: dTDP-4-dehydrorhamnose reductase [Candidatus Omnitrophota bacterium]
MAQENKKRIMVIGARGLLGEALCRELSGTGELIAPRMDELDITDRDQTKAFCRAKKPEIIILSAAYTDVDGCEKNPDQAYRVNVEGTRHVVEIAREINAVLIFISTDYVFNGETHRPYTEEDQPDPLSVYGRSKLQAESIIQSNLKEFVIARSCWLFGEAQKGFVHFIVKSLNTKKSLDIVADKIGSPTYAVDLAKALHQLTDLMVQNKFDFYKNNIIHIVNSGACSWYDMAKFIIEKRNVMINLKETKLEDFPFQAIRPKYSALDNSRYAQITGRKMRSWQDALGEFIQCQKN